MQFPIICSLQYSINIITVEVDPHSDLLHICIVKPKNSHTKFANFLIIVLRAEIVTNFEPKVYVCISSYLLKLNTKEGRSNQGVNFMIST